MLTVLCCQVECDPLCDLLWLREDVAIEAEDEMFEIIEEVLPEDPDNNVFVSVRSTLRKRANVTFVHEMTNFTLSCQVSGHQFGESLSSSMSVLVECKCLLYSQEGRSLFVMFRSPRGHHLDGGQPGGDGGGGGGARPLCWVRLSSSLLLLDIAGGGGGGGRHLDLPPASGARPGRGVFLSRS